MNNGPVDLSKPQEQVLVEAASRAIANHPLFKNQGIIIIVQGPQTSSLHTQGFINGDQVVGCMNRHMHMVQHQ